MWFNFRTTVSVASKQQQNNGFVVKPSNQKSIQTRTLRRETATSVASYMVSSSSFEDDFGV
jgi:hypothetical protein